MNLEALRVRSANAIAIVGVLLGVLVVGLEWSLQGGPGLGSVAGIGAALALGLTFVVARNGQTFRYVAVSVLMTEVMAMLIAMRGNPLQIDVHMMFFAALAFSVLMYDVRAILLGTVLVAIHHLGLGLFMEDLVFYGGGSLVRIVMHAVILVAESAALVWLAATTQKLMASLDKETAQVREQASLAAEQSALAEKERQLRNESHAEMLTRLQDRFGRVVDAAVAGDFSKRVPTDFEDKELNSLAGNVNVLVETVDHGLQETGEVLSALADTNLTRRVTGAYQGAFLKLKTDTNAVGDKLTDVVSNLRLTSRGLKVATGEILAGANDLSERTTKQAAAIEETSAAMEQIAGTVNDNSKRADQANGKAQAVSKSAQEAGLVMQKSNEAMERISTSSSKISNIIGMIDDIAFQTNLLALNASVEAARAGDAGKGFAVVAVEVRRLAQSAASASSEVKVLIEQSGNEVAGGSKLVADATQRLGSMVEGVRESAALIEAIAQATREQSSAIAEVSTAIREMDEMTQHNAALVEETNAAIEKTEGQANELDRIVDVFVVEEGPSRDQARAEPRKANPVGQGIKALQDRVKSVAKSYLSQSNAAVKDDWAEF